MAERESRRDVNDRREIFGWLMYDWANSAFYTTVVGALFGPYLTELARADVGDNGTIFNLVFLGPVTAKSLHAYTVAAAVFLQFFLLPILGAIADYTNLKKPLMAAFCYIAVAANCLMFFVTGDLYLLGSLLFIISNLCYGAAIVFYNAYLPEITTEDQRDKVSSRGFALGYLGGGLLLALNLALVSLSESIGISKGMAVRISLLSAGVWWGGFALITFSRLKTRGAPRKLPADKSLLTVGFSQLASTLRELKRLRHTFRYLISYLLYNDGIQTVIGQASVFLAHELFIARGQPEPQAFLLSIYLLVQFLAIGGSLLFERVALWLGTKNAILVSLAVWAGIVIYVYGLLQTTTQAWVLAGMIALVLGGSQALSRSLFSRMIPKGRENSFFGLYEVSERGTSWIGPLVFGLVAARTNSYRHAVLSLIFFFVAGMVILFFTDTDRAVHEAGNVLPEEVGK
ncbi:MAG TPA: MFS transporter [Pyrinomonadaceae bacterium]|nr:MFS transporter [Pyrinomonadaceae bacterium]